MSAGLTVRWSLADAGPEVAQALRDYVAGTSHARFEELEGLRFKTWRMREGAWFEGCYVFVDDAARQRFEDQFTGIAATSPGSEIIGSSPILIERCEIVAVALGPEGAKSQPTGER